MQRPEPAEPFERTFTDESTAAEVIKRLESAGISSDASVIQFRDPAVTQTDDDVAVGPGVVITGRQARAAGRWVVIAGGIGAILGAIAGAVFMAATTAGWPLFGAMTGAAAVCGATVGALLGGREAGITEGVREEAGADRRIVVRAHPADPVQERIAMEMFAQPDPAGPSGAPRQGIEPGERPEPPEGGSST